MRGHERRIEVLEGRVDQLEALLEGLQDAVHRESVREGGGSKLWRGGASRQRFRGP